ncbi:choice-of-anchor R domain-containing protein [Bdellovibrionota bacterium FG-1]
MRQLPVVVVASFYVFGSLGCAPIAGITETLTLQCYSSFTTVPATAADLLLQSSVVEVAQSFKVLLLDALPSKVQLKLVAIGAPTGNLVLKIESDNSGAPDGVPLASATLDSTTVKITTADFYSFTFSSAPSLKKATTYWLRLKFPTATATNSVEWIGNNDNAYTDGAAKTSTDGTNWLDALVGTGRDFLFKLGC